MPRLLAAESATKPKIAFASLCLSLLLYPFAIAKSFVCYRELKALACEQGMYQLVSQPWQSLFGWIEVWEHIAYLRERIMQAEREQEIESAEREAALLERLT